MQRGSDVHIMFRTAIEVPAHTEIRAYMIFKNDLDHDEIVDMCPLHLSKCTGDYRCNAFYLYQS